jgi:hypothetical protein
MSFYFYDYVSVFLFVLLLVTPAHHHHHHHHLVASAVTITSSSSNHLPFANYDEYDYDTSIHEDKTQAAGVGDDVHGDGNHQGELDSWTTLVFENDKENDSYYKHLTFREIDFLNKAWMATLDTVLSDKRMVALGVETIAELHDDDRSHTSSQESNDNDKSNPTTATKQDGADDVEEVKGGDKNNQHYHLRRSNQQHRAARYSRGQRTRYRQSTSYHCRLCNNNNRRRRRYQRRDLLKQQAESSSSSDTDAGANTTSPLTTSLTGIFDQKSTKQDVKSGSTEPEIQHGHEYWLLQVQELLQDMVCEILRSGPHAKFHKVKECIVSFQESA